MINSSLRRVNEVRYSFEAGDPNACVGKTREVIGCSNSARDETIDQGLVRTKVVRLPTRLRLVNQRIVQICLPLSGGHLLAVPALFAPM